MASASSDVSLAAVSPQAMAWVSNTEPWHHASSRGHTAGGNPLDPAFFGQRVSAGPRQLAVGEGQFAGVGEQDERNGAESELATSAADDLVADDVFGPEARIR